MAQKLYEMAKVRAATGETIRPGGLALTDRAVGLCGFPVGARVLDVGCGPGATVEHLRRDYGLRAVGLDPSGPFLEEARLTCPDPLLVAGRAEQPPFQAAAFEGVFLECVLSLTADPSAVLVELRRILASGGYLILADLYARAAFGAATLEPVRRTCCLKGVRDRETIENMVAAAGFSILAWEDQSDHLRRLAAHLVWTHGSWRKFLASLAREDNPGPIGAALNQARPGYYLLVAQKGDAPCLALTPTGANHE